MATVSVNPTLAVIDEEVELTVTNLEPNSPVTISASIVYHKTLYTGFGHFFADGNGYINLKIHPSYGGTYTGLQPMGLFTSMRAMPSKYACPRLLVTGSVEIALKFKISVWKNHLTQDKVYQLHLEYVMLGTGFPCEDYLQKHSLCQCELHRTYLSLTVERIPIETNFKDEVILGVMFMPKGDGPFPGIIDICSIDAFLEIRAALLAKHGFAVLALNYLGNKRLNSNETTPGPRVSYFDKSVTWFSQHPKVQPGGVSVVGVSFGAQIALLTAIRNELIKSVVCINSNGIMTTDSNCDNPVTDFLLMDSNGKSMFEIWHGRFSVNYDNWIKLSHPVLNHRHDPPTLFLVGKYDFGHKAVDEAIERLLRSGKKNVLKKVIAGEGHLIEPPYMPLCVANHSRSSLSHDDCDPYAHLPDYVPWDWNGNYAEHGNGQIETWRLLLDFLRKHGSNFATSKL